MFQGCADGIIAGVDPENERLVQTHSLEAEAVHDLRLEEFETPDPRRGPCEPVFAPLLGQLLGELEFSIRGAAVFAYPCTWV